MKLIELRVQNYRGIKGDNVKISFDGSDIIFLLGQNNAGKSSMLSAYEQLRNPKFKPEISDFYGHNTDIPIVIEGIFRKEPGDEEEFADKGLDKWVGINNLVQFRVIWEAPGQGGQKYTFDPTKNEFQKNGFGGFDTIFSHHAPTPIRIPAMPSLDELPKWVSDTFKTVILKRFQDEEHETYKKAVEQLESLQSEMTSESAIGELVKKSNANFSKVFPGLSLNISSKDQQSFDFGKLFEKNFELTIKDEKLPELPQNISSQGHGVIRQAMFNTLGILKELDSSEGSKKNSSSYSKSLKYTYTLIKLIYYDIVYMSYVKIHLFRFYVHLTVLL